MSNFVRRPILQLVKELQDGQTYTGLLDRTMKEAAKANKTLGTVFLDDMKEGSSKVASNLDEQRSKGNSLPLLAGIPISIKDNFCVKDSKTTAGSKMLETFLSPYDATVVEKLKSKGAIPCLKANLDEFGMGSSMANSAFGPCANPWGSTESTRMLTPGGSSGASAVAVASGVVAAAIGSDTGGSVRQPASFCGVVGFKPSYGRCSRHGLISYASSMDTPGIIAGNVLDTILVFDSIRGYDRKDSTSSNLKEDALFDNYTQSKSSLDKIIAYSNEKGDISSLKGKVIGIPQEFIVTEMDGLSLSSLHKTVRTLESYGVQFKTVSIPSLKYALPAYYVIACAEASSNLSRYDGIRYGKRHMPAQDIDTTARHATNLHKMMAFTRSEAFGPEVIKRILTGCFVLSESAYNEYYGAAHGIRQTLRRQMSAIFGSGVDALLSLTAPVLPFHLDSPPDSASMMLNDFLTVPANLALSPAISIPCDIVNRKVYRNVNNNNSNSISSSSSSSSNNDNNYYEEKLPVGIQLIGAVNNDMKILELALAAERGIKFKDLI